MQALAARCPGAAARRVQRHLPFLAAEGPGSRRGGGRGVGAVVALQLAGGQLRARGGLGGAALAVLVLRDASEGACESIQS